MVQWYAVVEKETGRLHATGTVIADAETLEANGFEAVPLDFDPQADHPEGGRWVWAQETRAFERQSPEDKRQRQIAFHQAELERLMQESDA